MSTNQTMTIICFIPITLLIVILFASYRQCERSKSNNTKPISVVMSQCSNDCCSPPDNLTTVTQPKETVKEIDHSVKDNKKEGYKVEFGDVLLYHYLFRK